MTLTFDKPGTLERAASDWTRDDDGRPWVLPDPDWTPDTAPDGWVKAGLVLPGRNYTRVTTFVEAPLDGTMLSRWKMRRVALGMGRRPDYVVAAAALTAEDRDKAALNDLAEKALEAAGPNAADIGTALHGFSERIDRGEPLGVVPPEYRDGLERYRELVEAHLTWVHREERMVCDALEVAGTPDGIAYCDSPDPDGVVGPLRIVDLKTGNVERTAGKFSAQLATYANSACYDAATGKRTWLADLDRRWGLVLHMPAGVGTAELRWLNLEHGWLGAQLAKPIRTWRSVGHGELMRPLVAPEPRQVPAGKCAGRKRDGGACTYKVVSNGFCGRHQDQVGEDPDAAVPARVTRAGAVVTEALESDADWYQRRWAESPGWQPDEDPEQPATVSTSVDEAVDAEQAARDLEAAAVNRADDAYRQRLQDARDGSALARELNGNPTPHTSMGDPETAEDAAQRAELALMDQVRACRTTGELAMLYEATGSAWSAAVKAYATRHRALLPELAQQERARAALLQAIAHAESVQELRSLFADPRNAELVTDEHRSVAKRRAAELPPF